MTLQMTPKEAMEVVAEELNAELEEDECFIKIFDTERHITIMWDRNAHFTMKYDGAPLIAVAVLIPHPHDDDVLYFGWYFDLRQPLKDLYYLLEHIEKLQ